MKFPFVGKTKIVKQAERWNGVLQETNPVFSHLCVLSYLGREATRAQATEKYNQSCLGGKADQPEARREPREPGKGAGVWENTHKVHYLQK